MIRKVAHSGTVQVDLSPACCYTNIAVVLRTAAKSIGQTTSIHEAVEILYDMASAYEEGPIP